MPDTKPGTRDKILQKAKELVYKHGFKSTSMDQLAISCGIKKANIFYYFATKEKLGLEILEYLTAWAEKEVLEPAFTSDLHPTEQVRHYIRQVRRGFEAQGCQGGCPLGNLAVEMADVDERFRTRLSDFFATWELLIENSLRRGQEKGQFGGSLNPKEAALFIVSALEGAILMAKTKRDPEVFANVEAHLVGFLESHQIRHA